MVNSGGSLSRFRREEQIEARLYYALSFAVFLVAAIVSRLLPRHWRSLALRPGGRRSIVGEARVAAGTCTAYAFMG